MSRVRVRVLVRGRVQGVWFRESTRERAEALGVDGWVRNLPGGEVEAEFEGEREAVDAAIAFVRVGPELARVDDVEVEERSPEGARGFTVRTGRRGADA